MKHGNFITREGTRDDIRDNWLWWTDSTPRQMMHATETVPWKDHFAWYESELADPNRFLFMFEYDRSKIGVVRLHPKAVPCNEASINLNPERRGGSLGVRLLLAGIDYVSQRREVEKYIAATKRTNVASVRSFERAGSSAVDAARSITSSSRTASIRKSSTASHGLERPETARPTRVCVTSLHLSARST
jgi:UDP-4-amino-4,6-dideoxy-N-acetyl-beta-L-altrosamine N-acetyltransferase